MIRKNKVDARYVALLLNVMTLAPEIVAATLGGMLQEDVTHHFYLCTSLWSPNSVFRLPRPWM